jgi:MATE family multidrug resistance protein
MMHLNPACVAGVVRGIGWQRMGAFANLGAYYIVGLPVAGITAFVFHWEGQVQTQITDSRVLI